jgi:DNA-binding sugar fermentation-stimulating protein
MYVEVKSVTMAAGSLALFPDTVSERAQKHVRLLMREVQAGRQVRAVLSGCVWVTPPSTDTHTTQRRMDVCLQWYSALV